MTQKPTQTASPANRDGRELLPMLQGFSANRRLTLDLLEALSAQELERKWPRPGLDTFSQQIQEMAQVQLACVTALRTGVMDFSPVPAVTDFPGGVGKEHLRELLKEADGKLEGALQGPIKASIRWDDMELPVEAHLTNLLAHEVFHQGQMAMAMYLLKIQVPESWRLSWALPPNG